MLLLLACAGTLAMLLVKREVQTAALGTKKAWTVHVLRLCRHSIILIGPQPKLLCHCISFAVSGLHGTDCPLCGLQLSSAAQLLGGAFHVGSLADAAAVGPALKALTSSALPQPLLATLASPRIKASQQVLLTFRLCTSPIEYIAAYKPAL